MAPDEEHAPSTRESAEVQAPTALARAWMYGALAMELTVGVVGGGLLGWYLDRRFATQPIWTLTLLLLGSTGGLFLFIRGLTRLDSQ